MLLSRRFLRMGVVAAVLGWPGTVIGQNVPPAAPIGPAPTLWHFLGLRQGSWMMRDAFLNSSGNFPGLERKPPLKKLSDPGLKEIDNAAIKKAQEIKAEEELAPQKIKAIKYLATLGCEKCYGGIEEAMFESLKDCTEEVRYETVKALGLIPNQRCPQCDHDCCTEKMTAQLAKIAYERDPERPSCWYEPSERVREEARRVLSICCQGGQPPIIEEGPPPEPKPEPRPEPRGEPRATEASEKAALFRLPKPSGSTAYASDSPRGRTAGMNPATQPADRAAMARREKPSLGESLWGGGGKRTVASAPAPHVQPTRSSASVAARQLVPTPAEAPVEAPVSAPVATTPVATTPLATTPVATRPVATIAQPDSQVSSRRVDPVATKLQQPATLQKPDRAESIERSTPKKTESQAPRLAPANQSASTSNIRTLGLSQPVGLLPVVGIKPATAIVQKSAPAAMPTATPVQKAAGEGSVVRLASSPAGESLTAVKRLPAADRIGPPAVPKAEESAEKAVTYGTKGTISRVSPQAGTVEVKFPSGGVPRVGSRMQVHHQYLFKTAYVGELQVIATGAGVATTKPFDGLELTKVSTGDTVVLQTR